MQRHQICKGKACSVTCERLIEQSGQAAEAGLEQIGKFLLVNLRFICEAETQQSFMNQVR